MPVYGYARVSTTGQTLSAQDAALKAAGCAKVFRETASGAKTDRPVLAKLLKALEPGDQVVVTRLDRLARSTRDLLNTLDRIGKAESTFRSIADTWADSSTPHGKLFVTILAGLAEFERSLILARTSEGRARAKARGQSLGRPFKLTPHQRREARERYAAGNETLAEIGRSYNVSHMTIARVVELEAAQ